MSMDDTKMVAKSLSITCFALFVLMLVTTPVSAISTTTISIADATMEPCSTVTLPILITNIGSYGTGTIDIEYDPSVVHVTDVTSSPDSTVTAKNIDNTTGLVRISAWNLGGVSGVIIFANVTFTSVGVGSTPLNLTVDTLQDIAYQEIPSVTVSNGSIEIETSPAPAPFSICGYVWYDDDTPCNNPGVSITNLDTGEEWAAKTSSGSNYYQIALTSGVDLNAGEMLRFNATDGTNANLTDHTITADDVNNGGLFGFNLTLESTGDPAPYLTTYTISNTTISPNGDGIEDDTSIDVEFSETVSAAIVIENASGFVRTLYTSSNVKDPKPKIWDGTDGGDIVACGTYQVNVTMDDGVNPLVYDNTKSIMVTEGITTSVFIADITTDSGDTVTVPIMINGIANYGTGTINIEYDPAVVHVTDVTSSSDSTVTAKNIDNTTGLVRISAWNLGGASGAIVFTDVIFEAVGSSGDSTPLTLTVDTLQDISYNEVPATVISGSFTIQSSADPAPSLVTYTISNTTISPNGDGIMDATEINVGFSEPVDAAILIENATGVVRSLYISPDAVTDPDPQTWDGTDDNGNIVADGTYYVNVTMDDGVNQVVYDNTRSIRVRTGPEVDVEIGCGIIYPHPYPGCSVTLPIALRGIIDYGAGTINLYYDASVVEVSDVTGSEDSSVESWNIVTAGWLMISALNATGVSGDVVFANVVFNSVGNIGECSGLNLTVDTLGDIYYEELPYSTTNCSICIEDPYAPIVSKPSANPDTILNDNGRARVPGTNVSVFTVTVTDANGIAGVTINLSSILGPWNDSVPMTNVAGTDQWTVEVNAPYDAGVGQVHNLAVNATDLFGNSNTAKTIELTVLRRGDVVRDNKVNMFDYLYIARYTVGLEPAPDELVAGTIPADSHNGVNMLDALYIARHTVNLESAP